MSKMRYVNTRIWDDEWFADLDPQSKLVFVYLLTNALTEISGAYEIRSRRIAFDTGLDEATIRSILDRFNQDGKIIYRDGWILIVNFIRHQSRNPKVEKGIKIAAAKSPPWVRNRLSEAINSLSHPNSDSDSESDPESDPESDSDTDPNPKPNPAGEAPRAAAQTGPGPLPRNFRPQPRTINTASSTYRGVDFHLETVKFADYYRSNKTPESGTWDEAWLDWIKKATVGNGGNRNGTH